MTRADIAAELVSLGEKPGNAGAVFLAVHRRGAADLENLPGVPARVGRALARAFTLAPLPLPERRLISLDGTRKLLFRFPGNAPAECVVLPGKDQQTACLSAQSGCACGCTFCATGALGLKRSLTPAEIIAQFEACLREAVDLRSLVFMGMGEPGLNWESVKKAILILSDSRGRHFPQVKMTVSTVGVIPVIEELTTSDLRVRLAVSLVAADPELRARLAPMEKTYPLKLVLAAVRRYCAARQALDVQHDFAAAVLPVRCLMFIDKFAHDLNQRQDALE